jgi:hypothetical protein
MRTFFRISSMCDLNFLDLNQILVHKQSQEHRLGTFLIF